MMRIRPFQESDRTGVVRLWRRCDLVAAGNDPNRDIDLKIAYQPDLLFVGESHGRVIATVMAGYDGHRGWINYLAVDPGHRRNGYGRELMAHAERALVELGCPKINVQVRPTNDGVRTFYEEMGYAYEDRLNFGKRSGT